MQTTTMQTLQLRDGRQLAISEYGDSNGVPVLFFHGTPNSRCFHHPDEYIAKRRGIRVISFDRPGYGESDAHPRQTLLQATEDVAELADALRLQQFAVAGISGGAPYALACAYAMADRIPAVAAISAMAPLDRAGAMQSMNATNRLGFWIARYVPFLLPLALKPMANSATKDPQATLDKAAADYAAPDQGIMARPDVREMYLRDIREAYRQGTQGHVDDLRRLARPWGVLLEDIRIPITFWHGQLDQNVPPAMAQSMAERLPKAELKLLPNEGHLLMFNHWDEILANLIQRGKGAEILSVRT